MLKLTEILDKYELSAIVLAGLDKLVGEEKALDIWETLEEKWLFTVNHRTTSRLGQCVYPHNGGIKRSGRNIRRVKPRPFGEIEVSGVLMISGCEHQRNETILHEVAHAVDVLISGRCNHHGFEWQIIMRAFGLRPDRVSTDPAIGALLADKRAKKTKLVYACQRCEHEFLAMRRKKYPAEKYRHGKCGGKLYFKKDANGHIHANPSKTYARAEALIKKEIFG